MKNKTAIVKTIESIDEQIIALNKEKEALQEERNKECKEQFEDRVNTFFDYLIPKLTDSICIEAYLREKIAVFKDSDFDEKLRRFSYYNNPTEKVEKKYGIKSFNIYPYNHQVTLHFINEKSLIKFCKKHNIKVESIYDYSYARERYALSIKKYKESEQELKHIESVIKQIGLSITKK